MNLKNQKRISAQLMKCSPKRIKFSDDYLDDIKAAITKADLNILINKGGIQKNPKQGVSRVRARKILVQKRKGLQQNDGSRKGKPTSRFTKKEAWMRKIRAQRALLQALKTKKHITNAVYKDLLKKAKGGFFRNRRHIKLYISEKKLITKN